MGTQATVTYGNRDPQGSWRNRRQEFKSLQPRNITTILSLLINSRWPFRPDALLGLQHLITVYLPLPIPPPPSSRLTMARQASLSTAIASRVLRRLAVLTRLQRGPWGGRWMERPRVPFDEPEVLMDTAPPPRRIDRRSVVAQPKMESPQDWFTPRFTMPTRLTVDSANGSSYLAPRLLNSVTNSMRSTSGPLARAGWERTASTGRRAANFRVVELLRNKTVASLRDIRLVGGLSDRNDARPGYCLRVG